MNKQPSHLQHPKLPTKQITLLNWAGLLVLAAALLYILPQLPSTYARFTAWAAVPPVAFRATTFADNIALAPGTSTTKKNVLVAQIVNGQIMLDFGTYQIVADDDECDDDKDDDDKDDDDKDDDDKDDDDKDDDDKGARSHEFPNVLRITNVSDRVLTLSWHFCANLASFLAPGGSVAMQHGEQVTLGFTLDIQPNALPGEYRGTLFFSGMNGFITYEIPVRLHLVAKGSSK